MSSQERYVRGMERLVRAVSELSLARDVASVREIVRGAARQMTGADGATFILREGDECHYVDEDAIGPLWKGRRFPLTACVSGWAMLNREAVVIENIYDDERVPAEAYRPTFVQSLAMAPIRTSSPIGAIGNYWGSRHKADAHEIKLLQALADSTSVALENVRVHGELESRVRTRTEQLQAANAELEAFASAVAHDLRSPVTAVRGLAGILVQEYAGDMPPDGMRCAARIVAAAERMDVLIKDLLRLSHVATMQLERTSVSLDALAREIWLDLTREEAERRDQLAVQPRLQAHCDASLMRIVLENLLSNARKFTRDAARPRIELGAHPGDPEIYFVRDNGAGFDSARASHMFAPFQRYHRQSDFPGTGVGLATVKRVIERHGGRIWAESRVGEGAVFYFTLGGGATHLQRGERSLLM